ncbi:hypothetical protein SKAU_G00314350 [Synaphobranchus kaupii]|uniref:Uncharacterized protein n=1 Tax=Synaphobranchus kaupii TaxID=118154 RepID=A0A9Q1ES98_SYNKA|nr:hypothetical protein SKAU_G00314350 [Synaphobranchus kaupii]
MDGKARNRAEPARRRAARVREKGNDVNMAPCPASRCPERERVRRVLKKHTLPAPPPTPPRDTAGSPVARRERLSFLTGRAGTCCMSRVADGAIGVVTLPPRQGGSCSTFRKLRNSNGFSSRLAKGGKPGNGQRASTRTDQEGRLARVAFSVWRERLASRRWAASRRRRTKGTRRGSRDRRGASGDLTGARDPRPPER